jgi:hypothetical protein
MPARQPGAETHPAAMWSLRAARGPIYDGYTGAKALNYPVRRQLTTGFPVFAVTWTEDDRLIDPLPCRQALGSR